jgi:hypothetical protein
MKAKGRAAEGQPRAEAVAPLSQQPRPERPPVPEVGPARTKFETNIAEFTGEKELPAVTRGGPVPRGDAERYGGVPKGVRQGDPDGDKGEAAQETQVMKRAAQRIHKLNLRHNSPETPPREWSEIRATQAEMARDALEKLNEYRGERQRK